MSADKNEMAPDGPQQTDATPETLTDHRASTPAGEARKEQFRRGSQRYRDRKKAEGGKAVSGPGGKDTTAALRMRRYRQRKKAAAAIK